MINFTLKRKLLSFILFSIFLITSTTVAIGQNFSIDFSDSAPNQVINAPTGINISNVDVSSGAISYGSFGTTFGGTPHAGSSGDWMTTSNPLSAKNFFFTITADPGYTFDLTAVSSLVRSTSAGASDMALIVDGDLIQSTATPNSGSPILSVSGSGLTTYTGLTSITIRIAGYDGGSRTSTGGGVSRIGEIEGTLVVNPPAVGPPLDVVTGTAGSITETGATISNNGVGDDGGSAITARGVVYGISANPTLADNVETVAGTTGSFDATLTGLTANTTYYARAYATNAEGTTYGNDEEFTTLCSVPNNITDFSVNCLNQSATASWTDAGCFDEYLLVVKEGSAVTITPTGDGSAYTADLNFGDGTSFDGGFVAYLGSDNSIPSDVTSLTNGEEYFFTVFTRKGTNWSAGITESCTPANITIINFDDNAKWDLSAGSGYQTGYTYISDNWTFTGGPALRNTTSLTDGFPGALDVYSWRLRDEAGVEWTATFNSTGIISQFGFDVRRWDGSPNPDYSIEYSTNGGGSYTNTGVTIDNAYLSNSSDWTTFSFSIPTPTSTAANQFIVKITRNGGERIMIDNFSFTLDASGPEISVTPSMLEDFVYQETNGPSASQSVIISGTNLSGVVSVSTVTNYEFSIDDITFVDAISDITPFSGTVPPTTVYVRLKDGLTAGNYNESITLSSTGAADITVDLNGTVVAPPAADCSELFFSEYIEGSSNNKCYEIYNPTDTDIDLASGNYSIRTYNNGSTTPNNNIAFTSGIVPAYGTYVVCNSGADAGFQAAADQVGGYLNGTTFYNGNDVLALIKDGDIIDAIGKIGENPGTAWNGSGVSTANQTLVRKSTILKGDNFAFDDFDPSIEWDNLPVDNFSNLGTHESECSPQIWTGTLNNDWNNAGNWASASVPVASDDVFIPSIPTGGNFPEVEVDAQVANLTIEAGANVDILAGQSITVSGVLENNGTFTVESDGALVQTTGSSLSGSGTFLVQRSLGVSNPWFVGSPINNQDIFNFGINPIQVVGGDGVQFNPQGSCDPSDIDVPGEFVMQLNEDATIIDDCSNSLWHYRSTGNLTNGRGYAVYTTSGNTLEFQGTVNNGAVTYGGLGRQTGTVTLPNASTLSRGWHLVSNPYPSPITLTGADLTALGFDAQIHRWNAGVWVSSNPLTSVTIAVGQGFQIRKTTEGGAVDFSLDNSFRTTDAATFYKDNNGLGQNLSITLSNEDYESNGFIYFKDEATPDFDPQFDANRLYGLDHIPLVYTKSEDNERLAYNALPLLEADVHTTVPLAVYDGNPGAFTLTFEELNSLETETQNVTVILEDLKLDEMIQISEGTTYDFVTEADDAAERFVVHFYPVAKEIEQEEEEELEEEEEIEEEEEVLSINDLQNQVIGLFPNPTESKATLMLDMNHTFTNVQVVSITGKVVHAYNVENGQTNVHIDLSGMSAGVYLVQVKGAQAQTVKKLVKK